MISVAIQRAFGIGIFSGLMIAILIDYIIRKIRQKK